MFKFKFFKEMLMFSIHLWPNNGGKRVKLPDNATWGIAPQEIRPPLLREGYTQIRNTTWFEEDMRDGLPNTQDLLI